MGHLLGVGVENNRAENSFGRLEDYNLFLDLNVPLGLMGALSGAPEDSLSRHPLLGNVALNLKGSIGEQRHFEGGVDLPFLKVDPFLQTGVFYRYRYYADLTEGNSHGNHAGLFLEFGPGVKLVSPITSYLAILRVNAAYYEEGPFGQNGFFVGAQLSVGTGTLAAAILYGVEHHADDESILLF